MTKKDLYDALSGIDKGYLAESESFEAISSKVGMERKRKLRLLVSACCFVVLCIAAAGIGKIGLRESGLSTSEEDNRLTSQVEVATEIPSPTTDPVQSVSESPSSDESATVGRTELFYSELVKRTESADLNGYNMAATLDIVAFDESMLKDSVGIIGGEIIDMRVNYYEYETASDKFEPDGRLHHKDSTVVYKILVDRVYSGDFSVGDVVTVEDYFFMFDSIISIKKGGSYIIPISKGDGKISVLDDVVGGSNVLESSYFTLYQFHPQIEKVSGGYVVTDDWETLITDECREIIMDIDEKESSYYGSMYFIPESVFRERMNLILDAIG